MDSFRKPEAVLSLAAIVLAGGSAVYTNNKINALTASLDKVIANVDAIGKKVGEFRLSEFNDNKEQVKGLMESLRKLDRFTYQFRQEMDEFNSEQQLDNDVIQEALNTIISQANISDVGDIVLTNVEESAPKKGSKKKKAVKKNTRFSKPQPPSSDEEEEDDVSSKLDRIRRRRRN